MQCPVPYAQDCVLLRAVARTLHLPPTAACTALVLLHQGRHSDDPWSLTPEDLVSAAIWAACKAEEVNCSSNQLINTVAVLSGPEGGRLVALLARTPPNQLQAQGPAVTAGAAANTTLGISNAPCKGSADHVPPVQTALGGGDPPAAHAAGRQEQSHQHPGTGRAEDSSHAIHHSSQQQPPPQQQQQQAAPPLQQRPGQAEGPGPPSGSAQPAGPPVVLAEQQALEASASALTGNAYYAAKQQLFTAEQHLLRRLKFQMVTPQPHAYLLNLVNLVRPPAAAAVAATCLLNDALVYTDCVVQHPPEVLAVAALAAAEQGLQATGAAAGIAAAAAGAGVEQAGLQQSSAAGPSSGSRAEVVHPPAGSDELPPWVALLDVPVQQVSVVRRDLMHLWWWLQQPAPGMQEPSP